MLPNASSIIQTAGKRLQTGEIGYLDWVILVNQAIDIRNQYLTTVQQANEAAIIIEKLSATN